MIFEMMMTMVLLFSLTLCQEDDNGQEHHGKIEDGHEMTPQRMMTMDDDHCQPDQFADKNNTWKQTPTMRKFEQAFHWF